MSKLEVKDSLKVKGESSMEILNVNKLKTKALTIDDNEIIFDSEAKIKMKNSKLEFEVRDLFEVITFMKYIVQICGSRLERCDFNHLIKNYTVNKLKAEVEKIQEKEKKEEQEEKMKQTKLEENKKEVKEGKMKS